MKFEEEPILKFKIYLKDYKKEIIISIKNRKQID